MANGDPSEDSLPPGLIPSRTGELGPAEVERLWEIFEAIAKAWGDPGVDPSLQRSQWLEFLGVRTGEEPSYLEEYRNAIGVVDGLRLLGRDRALETLLFPPAVPANQPATTRLAHAKRYVVDEFIRVWLTSGGFRAYGAANYNSAVNGSRFAIRPPYRLAEPPKDAVPAGPNP